MDELAQVTELQRAMWGAGDYVPFEEMLRPSSGRLVTAAEVAPGELVLDVGCGTGNTSIAAARAGARVTGVDLTPRMLEGARAAVAREGAGACTFLEGDVQALPLPDAAFDVALSTFGCMFAPDHARTAAELVRVVRPGGRIGFTGWTPEGDAGRFLRVVGSFAPPPPASAGNPLAWGDAAYVRGLFDAAAPGARVRTTTERVTVVFDSPEDAVTTYATSFGPMVLARPALEEAGAWDPMLAALDEFFAGMAPSRSGGLLVDYDYLQTVVVTPA